jgi:hypothetical protein
MGAQAQNGGENEQISWLESSGAAGSADASGNTPKRTKALRLLQASGNIQQFAWLFSEFGGGTLFHAE